MTKIAIIKKNDIDFMEMEKYAVPLLYTDHDIEMRIQIKKNLNDYIWKTIEPYIEFVNIGEDLLTTVCHNLTKILVIIKILMNFIITLNHHILVQKIFGNNVLFSIMERLYNR